MENKNKFKVGDRVRVKAREDIKNIESNILFVSPKMDEYCGKYMTIGEIHEGIYIKLSEDVEQWSWDSDWLEPALSKKEQLKEEIKEKQRELSKIYEEEEKKESPKGYLDDINTWYGAIDKMMELNKPFELRGKFVIIDGVVHFNMCVDNDWFKNSRGIQKLLSK